MEQPILKYIGHKARKVKWEPVEKEDIVNSLYFATGSYDDKLNRVCLWRYNSDAVSGTQNEPQEVSNVIVHADVTDLLFINNRLLFATLANGSVTLLEHVNQELVQVYKWNKVHSSLPCTSITKFSHSPGTVLTGGEDGRIMLLSVERSHPNQVIEDNDGTSITSLLSYYHNEVFAGNFSGQLKLWDLRVNSVTAPAKTFPINSSEMVSVQCLDYHPNQPHLITAGCGNGIIGFLDIRQEKVPISLIQGHTEEVWEARFHSHYPDNLITCSQDGSLFHWASLNHYKSTMATSDSIWLSPAIAKGKVDIKQLLPESNSLSVNSFDVEKDCLLAVTDGEALYVIPNLDFH